MVDLIDEIAMGPFGSDIKVEFFVDNGIPVLNGSNLDGFSLTENSFRYVTEEKANSLKKANAERGDIVITHRGTLGQIAYIPSDSKYERYVISQSQFRVRCNEKVLPEYLVYYFHTRIGQHKLLSNKSQVGVPALGRPTTTFRSIEVEIPDVQTQKRIIGILTNIEDKITNNKQINDNLYKMAQVIFKSWFIDFEPFSDGKFVFSNEGNIPEGWRIATLDDCCCLISKGITPKYTDSCEQRVINQKCIRGNSINLQLARCHIPKSINEKWLHYGDILVNSTGEGTLGRAAQVHFNPANLTVDSHVTILRPSKVELIQYLGCLLLSKQKVFEGMASGSTGQTDLPRDRLKAMSVLVPPEDILDAFSSIVSPMMDQIVILQEEISHLVSMRDTLLPKLMSGELSVTDS